MRKLLLGTSALIGATALVASASAAAPELTISGNLDFQWVGGENQAAGPGVTRDRGAAESGWNFDQAGSTSEIRFHAEGESDGGTTYGARIDYRYLGGTTDEAYIFVSGDWGTVHLGQDDGAVDAIQVGADSIAPGAYLINGWNVSLPTEFTIGSRGAGGAGVDGDAQKISYFTNDLSGFRFGVSVTEASSTAGGVNENLAAATTALTASQTARNTLVTTLVDARVVVANAGSAATDAQRTAVTNARNALNGPATTAGTTAHLRAAQNAVAEASHVFEDIYEIAANYTLDFGEGNFTVSGGYYTADANDDYEDLEEYVLGFRVNFGDFSVAGAYSDAGESGLTPIQKRDGGEAREYYNLGIAYNLGGGMAVGISYAEAQDTTVIRNAIVDTTTPANDRPAITSERTQELIAIDFGFPIMEGMAGYAGIAFSEYEDEDPNTIDDDATTYVIGTTVSF